MPNIQPPSPGATVNIQLKGIPTRLWWKIMETAQKQGVSASYFIFRTLAEVLDYNQAGEDYDQLLREIKEQLGD
jgi:hypothetical protein